MIAQELSPAHIERWGVRARTRKLWNGSVARESCDRAEEISVVGVEVAQAANRIKEGGCGV